MKCKLCFLLTAMLLYSSVLYAQFGTSERSILSLQTGPTFYTGKLIGVAGHSSSLRNGIGWSGSYTYLIGNKPAIRVGFGVLYQGSRYTNDMPNSSDKIQTHYFAPQFSLLKHHLFTSCRIQSAKLRFLDISSKSFRNYFPK